MEKLNNELFFKSKRAGFFKTKGYFQEKALDIYLRKSCDIKYNPSAPIPEIKNKLKIINSLIDNTSGSTQKRLSCISLLLSEICMEGYVGIKVVDSVHSSLRLNKK